MTDPRKVMVDLPDGRCHGGRVERGARLQDAVGNRAGVFGEDRLPLVSFVDGSIVAGLGLEHADAGDLGNREDGRGNPVQSSVAVAP